MERLEKKTNIIVNKMGLTLEIAKWCISIHKKYAIWIAKQIKENRELFPQSCGDFENILDWKKLNPIINLNDYTFKKALRESKKYFKVKNPFKKNNGSLKNEKIFLDLGSHKWVILETQKDLEEESNSMNHCVGRGPDYLKQIEEKRSLILSLRDKYNLPHITIQIYLKNKNVLQFKGNSNSNPKGKYLKHFTELVVKNNNLIESVSDYSFWNSLAECDKKDIEDIDKAFPGLINFERRFEYGLSFYNIENRIFKEDIHLFAKKTIAFPNGFKLFGTVEILGGKNHLEIGENCSFSDNVKLESDSLVIGKNINIGGNLTIIGCLKNEPENLRVGGDITIINTSKEMFELNKKKLSSTTFCGKILELKKYEN